MQGIIVNAQDNPDDKFLRDGMDAALGRAAMAPPFDAARYWSYLEGLEASDAEKAALLEALWSIMARFVEIGFGVDPVQAVMPALVAASLAEADALGVNEGAAQPDFDAAAGHTNSVEDER